MINYLVQTTAAHPDLARGVPPAGLLNAAEQRFFCSLKSAKRQRDWLLGRWTAKQLLQAVVAQQQGESLSLDSFTILNRPGGAPIVTSGYFAAGGFSISHRDDYAICAVSEPCCPDGLRVMALGVDIERVEPRADNFARDYFTEAELAKVRCAPAGRCDWTVTAIWSAKEAALKALRRGLTVDTHAVSCAIEPLPNIPGVWTPFEVCYDGAQFGRRAPELRGWWRGLEGYVLTLVAETALCASSHEIKHVTCGSPLMLRRPQHVTLTEVRA